MAPPVWIFADIGDQPRSHRVGEDVACLYQQVFVVAQAMVVEAWLPDRAALPARAIHGPCGP